eukprot:m.485116 g.485116  ORF g.485116 m.485116 type:complete len:173 (+) comp23659_c0_seq1:246-764(+)
MASDQDVVGHGSAAMNQQPSKPAAPLSVTALLANLPSTQRGNFAKFSSGQRPKSKTPRQYTATHDTRPPAHQVITNEKGFLLRMFNPKRAQQHKAGAKREASEEEGDRGTKRERTEQQGQDYHHHHHHHQPHHHQHPRHHHHQHRTREQDQSPTAMEAVHDHRTREAHEQLS